MIKIENLTKDNIDFFLKRSTVGTDLSVVQTVTEIIDNVIKRGDEALLQYTACFDGVSLTADKLRVTVDEQAAALAQVPKEVIDCLKLSADRIRTFHVNQLPRSWTTTEKGIMTGQRWTPVGRAGLYVPGGLANYPSSVLMNAIPAQIAGVSEIVLCVPPDKDSRVSKYTLAAAAVIGLDHIYRVGGAQAIAAMAYGTATIKKVDKITGPGNIYVATAKKLVVGAVDIDMIAGPTEVVIIADGDDRPDFIALDMIAQAEHDPLATAVLLTDDSNLAQAVDKALEVQISGAAREDIARQALGSRGRILLVNEFDLAVEFVNRFAPEHLEIMTSDPQVFLPRIKNAGAIFLGAYTPEAIGDYVAGSNHVLPTGSTARFYSPLGVYDFIKWSSILSFTREGLEEVGSRAVCLADVEGLEGHGRSVKRRLNV